MMKTTQGFLLVATLLFAGASGAQPDDLTRSERAQALMAKFAEESGAPGLAVSVGLKGEMVWSQGFGFADLEQQVPVDPARSLFRNGSTVKPMTAVAALQLHEEGRLDLDASVQDYVPSFPDKGKPITTRQLLAHLGGIRHYQGAEFLLNEHYETVLESLTIFQDDPLVNSPGEAYSYSSYGYNLIGAVIEAASGMSYLDHMQGHVFTPIGMQHTVPDRLDVLIPFRGRYYVRSNGELRNAPQVNNSYKWASGGYLSTSDDLVRFGMAQLERKLLSPETTEMMWTAQHTIDGEKTAYGLGWRVQPDGKQRAWVGHGGGSMGGTTQLWILPEQELVIAMLCNQSQFDYGEVLISLADLFVAP